jgi:hypothetical protein
VTSKFSGLKAMRDKRQTEHESPREPDSVPPRRVGRPTGKRSDPNYQQVTVLLNSETYKETRKRLLDEKKEVSTLLNELLDAWLKA